MAQADCIANHQDMAVGLGRSQGDRSRKSNPVHICRSGLQCMGWVEEDNIDRIAGKVFRGRLMDKRDRFGGTAACVNLLGVHHRDKSQSNCIRPCIQGRVRIRRLCGCRLRTLRNRYCLESSCKVHQCHPCLCIRSGLGKLFLPDSRRC